MQNENETTTGTVEKRVCKQMNMARNEMMMMPVIQIESVLFVRWKARDNLYRSFKGGKTGERGDEYLLAHRCMRISIKVIIELIFQNEYLTWRWKNVC